MKKNNQWVVIIICGMLTASVAACQSQDKPQETEIVSLFNGKNLDGWHRYGKGEWTVTDDGILIGASSGEKGYSYLATDEEYKNFVLTVQFKQKKKGNSGVFFHSSVEGTKVSGWQAEIAPPGHHTAGIYESYGRGWLAIPDSSKESVLHMGQWNTMKIRVNGDTVDTWLNNTHMVQLIDEKIGNRSGHIVLQIHQGGGVGVQWKKIELKKL